MNKQEANEKLTNIANGTGWVTCTSACNIISQIDQPQTVVVPKFVAEWLKEYRHASPLLKVLNAAEDGRVVPSAVNDWILDNQRDFVVAWYDGFDIEQEKLYTVEIPDPNSYCDYRYLSRNDNGICLDASNDTKWKKKKRNRFTESEIKQDFEWAWQFAKEVE
ncbi:TPA: DUF1642 domain-containing protein [Streptococcus suis]|nr:DUF1642 domain-containing protein [Streptococcus suis]HEL1734359.1 DUF1642 domain-containing protein [Streptococcus suis]HEM4176723.1 DUF1642 domain-containing protein [Streptococcus suis]